jgi:hypothetical protein
MRLMMRMAKKIKIGISGPIDPPLGWASRSLVTPSNFT